MQARIAPSLGDLEGTHDQVWGTTPYKSDTAPALFMGLYGFPDFYTLWKHKGERYILWCGTDITHFINGYWLEDGGGIKLEPEPLAQWIQKNCNNWVENELEKRTLEEMGIYSEVCPSFMGDISNYKIEYVPEERPQVYLSVSGNNFKLYGWDIIEQIAHRCSVDFHLYGNTESWPTKHANVFVHGRKPKEQMNEEIKKMHCGLRLCLTMDGFSEITAKSVLWGQYPIVAKNFGYKYLNSFGTIDELVNQINSLKYKSIPNPARDWYIKNLNKYPWNTKI